MLVTAKRLGWNQPQGTTGKNDDFGPPAWIDDGLPPEVRGELKVQTFPADAVYQERTVYTVDGQLVDPATITPVE